MMHGCKPPPPSRYCWLLHLLLVGLAEPGGGGPNAGHGSLLLHLPALLLPLQLLQQHHRLPLLLLQQSQGLLSCKEVDPGYSPARR